MEFKNATIAVIKPSPESRPRNSRPCTCIIGMLTGVCARIHPCGANSICLIMTTGYSTVRRTEVASAFTD